MIVNVHFKYEIINSTNNSHRSFSLQRNSCILGARCNKFKNKATRLYTWFGYCPSRR